MLENLANDELLFHDWYNFDWSGLFNELTTRGRLGLFDDDIYLLEKILDATQENVSAYQTVCLLIAIEYQRRGENFNARVFLNLYNETQSNRKIIELLPDTSSIALLYAGKIYSQDLSLPSQKAYKILRRWEEVSGQSKANQRDLLRVLWRISLNSALQGDELVAKSYFQRHASMARELGSTNQLANSQMIRAYLDSLNGLKPLKISEAAAWGIKYYIDANSTRSVPQMLLIDGGAELKLSRRRPSAYAKLLLAQELIPVLQMKITTEGISEALRVLTLVDPFAVLVFFHANGLIKKYNSNDFRDELNGEERILLTELGDAIRILQAGWEWARNIAHEFHKTDDLSSMIRALYKEGMLSGGVF